MAGFECEFVEKPPTTFPQSECPICLLVLREPYQAACCGKSFCKECIHRIKAANQACPTCNEKDFTLFPNLGLQQSLYDFRVYCMRKSKGCEWTGELRELDNHLNSDPPANKAFRGCRHMLIKCPLGCAGCAGGVMRKDMKSHIGDQLLNHVMIQSALNEDIIEKLAQLEAIFQQRMTKLEAVFEQRMTKSVTAFEQRMTKLEEKVSELDRMVTKLQPLGQCQQPDGHVTGTYKPVFTMINFDEYKRDNDSWCSPHFYTHPNGYKMCLRVYANGILSGRGTHLSVYVCLIRGEFDDQLKWPFRGNISIKLMNQEEDRDHIAKTIPFTESLQPTYCQRVMTDVPSAGHGYGQFLPLTELRPKYLRNNCIKLCIKKVEVF